MNRLKKQRYKCKECGKIFGDYTKSPISYSKKEMNQWLDYMQCMNEGLTIRETAKRINIHRNTDIGI